MTPQARAAHLADQWEALTQSLSNTLTLQFTLACTQGEVNSGKVQFQGNARDCEPTRVAGARALQQVFGRGTPNGEYIITYASGAVSAQVPDAAKRERRDIKNAMKKHLLLPALTQWRLAYSLLPTDEHMRKIVGCAAARARPSGLPLNELSWQVKPLQEVLEMLDNGGWCCLSAIVTDTALLVIMKGKKVFLGFPSENTRWGTELQAVIKGRLVEALLPVNRRPH